MNEANIYIITWKPEQTSYGEDQYKKDYMKWWNNPESKFTWSFNTKKCVNGDLFLLVQQGISSGLLGFGIIDDSELESKKSGESLDFFFGVQFTQWRGCGEEFFLNRKEQVGMASLLIFLS